MPTVPEGGRKPRSVFRFRELFTSWWEHRASFFISVGITVAAPVVYFFTFLGERPTSISNFLQRLELDTLDMRFNYRPANSTPHDERIVIVDIDQHSQEVLGRWPFSRSHFANLLDVLKQDNAKTVAFDITFSKPDQSGAAVRELWGELEVKVLVARFDADRQFAVAIKNFGAVVLGSYFLYTEADMRGMDAELDPRPEIWQRDRINLIKVFGNESTSLIPQGAEANIPELSDFAERQRFVNWIF